MAYRIYPDEDVAFEMGVAEFTPIRLAPGEGTPFLLLANFVGPDLSAGDQPTLFIRFAFSGAPIAPALQPQFELATDDGGRTARVDPNAATSLAAAVPVTAPDGAVVAKARFEPPYTDNIYLLKLAIQRPGVRLSLKITNTTASARDIVWVAADSAAETRQPWVHARFPHAVIRDLRLWASKGEFKQSGPLLISNFGTGPTTIIGTSPPLPAPVEMQIDRRTLLPNQPEPSKLTASFTAPPAPYSHQLTITLVTANPTDPGPFGAGHNPDFAFWAATTVSETLPKPVPPFPPLLPEATEPALPGQAQRDDRPGTGPALPDD